MECPVESSPTQITYNTISGHRQLGFNIRDKTTLQPTSGAVIQEPGAWGGAEWDTPYMSDCTKRHSRWQSLELSTVAARHGFWLKPGQQRSHDSPQVLCWHLQWSLKKEDETAEHSDSVMFDTFENNSLSCISLTHYRHEVMTTVLPLTQSDIWFNFSSKCDCDNQIVLALGLVLAPNW